MYSVHGVRNKLSISRDKVGERMTLELEFEDKQGRKVKLEVNEEFKIVVDGREYRIPKEDVPAIEMALTKYYRELMRKAAEKYLKRREELSYEDNSEGDRSRSRI